MALAVQGGQRFENRADDGAALPGDDPAGQAVAHAAARGAGVDVTRLGADVVGTPDRRAVGKRLAHLAGRRGTLRRGRFGDGRTRPRGSRVRGYVGAHGDSCLAAEVRPSPC
ncbi:hypothetical protein GCM10010531_24330 [Blastococcus jejuensis]|uniref:Uncharacterized protein n=1 Tax=Blastococcus jejuensis TaxID=351224 RepID=A0ABP6P7M3_9ACTN